MRRHTRMGWLILLPLSALFAGCAGNTTTASGVTATNTTIATGATPSGHTSASGPNASSQSSSCREPTATPQDQLPEVLRKAGPGHEWIGEHGLWVEVSWINSNAADWKVNSGYSFKYATVTLVDGQLSARPGEPTIGAHRLHGSAQGAGSFGGYASASGTLPHWWPTGLDLPSGGCWVVTEESGGTAVSFQVQLP